MADPRVKFDITAADHTRGAFASVQRQLTGMTRMVTGLVGTVSAGLVGRKVFNDFRDFDRSLTRIITLTGTSADQVAAWREELVAMAGEVGKPPKELADALYFVVSSGVPAARAIDTVRSSAMAAAIGLGETETVADAATSAMNAYAKSNLSAADATAILLAAVRLGKAEAPQLAGAIGTVIPTASKLGVEFHEVGAALAAMTQTGTSADEAVTQLNAVLLTTLQPTEKSAKALASVGLSAAELRRSLREDGLLATLVDIDRAFGGNVEAIAQVFGNVRALRGVFNLLGDNVENVEAIFADLARTAGGDLVKAHEQWADTVDGKLSIALSKLDAHLDTLGSRTIPVLVDGLELVIDNFNDVAPAATAFMGALAGLRLGGIMGGVVGALAGGVAGLAAFREELEKAEAAAEEAAGGFTIGPDGKPEIDIGMSPEMIERIEATKKLIREIELEQVAVGLSARAHEQWNAHVRAGLDPITQWNDDLASAIGLLFDLKTEQEQAAERMQFFGDLANTSLSSLIFKGGEFADVMDRVAVAIGETALQALVLGQGPLASLFGTADPSGGVGGLFGLLSDFAGGFAAGGKIPAGKWGFVGEKGIEIASGPATITPLAAMGGGLTFAFHNDFRGADAAAVPAILARIDELQSAMPMIAVRAMREANYREVSLS